MFKKISAAALLFTLTVPLSSCSVIGGQSEAYKLGVESGKQYLTLKDSADLIDSYISDEENSETSLQLNVSADDLKKYCSGIWIITGISNGIKNSPENKADYIAGCLNGAGF